MTLNLAHIHLLLNHVPVLGTIFGLALLVYALAVKSEGLKKLSFGLFFLMALAALPVYFTGEPAEEIVEDQAGISKPLIERHEGAALASLLAVEVAGLLGLAGLVLSKRGRVAPRGVAVATAGIGLVATILIGRTARLGGQIHHEEIRAGAQAAPSGDHEPGEAEEEAEHRGGQ